MTPMFRKALGLFFVCGYLSGVASAGSFPDQPYSLLPQPADDGVLFQCYAPDARAVYLAGNFNAWAHNDGGRITDAQFAMQGPNTNGVWRKVVKLDPGTYKFKFNLNGDASGWFAPNSIDEHDDDGNAVLRVGPGGEITMHSARNPQWKPQRTDRGVLFQFYAPDAFIVYLAGDFNRWGMNKNGLVSFPNYALYGPDSNGVWRADVGLPAGTFHYQYVIDGDHWVADPNVDETDKEGHSVLVVQ